MRIRLHQADSIELLQQLPAESIRAIVCDPPYGLEFMGKEWDSFGARGSNWPSGMPDKVPDDTPRWTRMPQRARTAFEEFNVDWLLGAYRVLMPGGVCKAFGGTRLFHRLAVAMEDVGFILIPHHALEAWCYGNGFPKSLNVAKAIDDHLGVTSEIVSTETRMNSPSGLVNVGQGGEQMIERNITAPVSDEAKRFDGYGTALKPAWEPIMVGIKPR